MRLRGTVDPAEIWIHKTDFTVYTEAGAAFFDGRDPYAVTNPRGWKYLYPPLFAMLVAPLHALPPQAQVLVWFALSVWMLWGCYANACGLHAAVARRSEPGPSARFPAGSAAPAFWRPCCRRSIACNAARSAWRNCICCLLGFRLLVESRPSLAILRWRASCWRCRSC